MVFVSIEDFYEKVSKLQPITRAEELELAMLAKQGDLAAREQLVQGYLPMVAGHVRHLKQHMQTLGMALYCVQALEKAVDRFDFMQESETFTHRLSWYLRQATVEYIVKG